jgi:outer membrane protein assembly factor BamD
MYNRLPNFELHVTRNCKEWGDNDMKAKYYMIAVGVISALLLVGCASKQKNVQAAPRDPAALYTEGMVLFNAGEYQEAIEVFTRLKDYFPADEIYAPKADLRIADGNFFRKEYPESITRYLEFKKQYPFHPDIPYAEYQLGLCYYRQILSMDRDQKATARALSAFQNVVSNYPNTVFAQKSEEKIVFCQRRLAENELYVADFYLRKGKYAAAEKRASSALAKYPDSGIKDQALYYLALALHNQDRDPEALTPLTFLVRDYPKSLFAKPGAKLLASLKTQGVIAASTSNESLAGTVSNAKPLDKTKKDVPFRISAKSSRNIPEDNAILYTGDVVALGDEVTVRCESLLLTTDKGDVYKEIVARKEVVVKKGEEEFFCNKAVWSAAQKTVVMTEDAKIRGVGEWTRGDEITLYLDTGKVEIRGERLEQMQQEEKNRKKR